MSESKAKHLRDSLESEDTQRRDEAFPARIADAAAAAVVVVVVVVAAADAGPEGLDEGTLAEEETMKGKWSGEGSRVAGR